ncbi:RNA chaperone ProQ [Candidatus Enterovibrio altilux]|nr:RNA chaperone ProQ [Candidatus Enterovibrio luxaltus]
MENTEKLVNSKQIIAYIAELFPNCFTLRGKAHPLKIGIFQDLSERIADDPKVSKTQLRAAIRQYTSSWRYLYGMKAGSVRVDLDGVNCGELEQEHIDHAQTILAESKARVAERRKEQVVEQDKKKANGKDKKRLKVDKLTANQITLRSKKIKNTKVNKKPVELRRELNTKDIIVGKHVNINIGNGNMPATVVELNKNEIRVRLSNGLTMLIKAEHLNS